MGLRLAVTHLSLNIYVYDIPVIRHSYLEPNGRQPRTENPSAKEMKAFLESREGVKGLVDSGITNIPQFLHPFPRDIFTKLFLGCHLGRAASDPDNRPERRRERVQKGNRGGHT
ncbi:hypothetical protein V6N11_073750 [Hibiscus sabdariffa]|uniref:Uncharacterized protein n=1 Tax=Hibiscus sabdariffa TaxID=183260 RepID=A0ABR2P4I6_9ROSI